MSLSVCGFSLFTKDPPAPYNSECLLEVSFFSGTSFEALVVGFEVVVVVEVVGFAVVVLLSTFTLAVVG